MKSGLFLIFAAVAIGGMSPSASALESYTGCKSKNGKVSKVALGDKPSRPCNKRQVEFTFTKSNSVTASPPTVRREWDVHMGHGDSFSPAPNVSISCDSPDGITIVAVKIQGRLFSAVSESHGRDRYFVHRPDVMLFPGDVVEAAGFFSAQGGSPTDEVLCTASGYIEYMKG